MTACNFAAVSVDELLSSLISRSGSQTAAAASSDRFVPIQVAMDSGPQPGSLAASSEWRTVKDPQVMYVVLRQDLDWPTGALLNQACHAGVAAAWDARADPEAILYFSEVEGQMTTVTLGVADEAQLLRLADKLGAGGVPCKLWTERPANVLSALATWPRRRSAMQKFIRGIKRF